MRPEKFKSFWKFLLAYTWFVILWGAFVRASGSGDGCGTNWPTCHGQLIPTNSDIQTWIEYIHRTTSGLYGLYVLFLVIWAWRFFVPRFKTKVGPQAGFQALQFFRSAYFLLPLGVLVFTIAEALIGAQLVLSGLVGSNESWARALVMVIHLMNTFILTACIVGTISLIIPPRPSEKALRWNPSFFAINTVGLFILASLGAIAALGDTLYPSETLRDGLQKDFAENAHFLIKLRIWHPILAVIVTWTVSTMAFQNIEQRYAKYLLFWMCSTFFIGLINLFLLAPIAMQLIHLLWAQVLWAQFCLYGFKNIQS